MEREELSRSGRVRKKSSKLLSIEQESLEEQKLAFDMLSQQPASSSKKVKGKDKSKPVAAPPVSKQPEKKSQKVVPKLRIKLGASPKVSKASKRSACVDTSETGPSPAMKKKKTESATPGLFHPHDCGTRHAFQHQNSTTMVDQKKAKKKNKKVADSVVKTEAVEPESIWLAANDEASIPQDLEMDIPCDSDDCDDDGDYMENQFDDTSNISGPGLSTGDESSMNATVDIFGSPPVDTSGAETKSKRERKPPTKLKEDYVDFERPSNKAAKFFETKKAESRAANAIAKQEAAKKAGKKGKRNRTPTAYTMWCNSYRPKLQVQCPDMDFATMNKKLGEVWWSIPLKEKNTWKRKAKRLATHGVSKNNADALTYVGSKGMVALKKKHPAEGSNTSASASATAVTRGGFLIPMSCTPPPAPVYKVVHTEPVDVAAHLALLSDSLTNIGTALSVQSEKNQSYDPMSLLLDTLLCGLSSLMCLTQQVPELDGNTDPASHRQRMENVAFLIPNYN